MLQPPGSNGLGLAPVDAGAENSLSDQAILGEADAGGQE
jgi:hypothetical protein